MIYRFGITTPANTLESSKQKTILKLARGVIHQLDIIFPPGPIGLLHLHINRGLHQVWPSNASDNFAIDNNVISFREHYELVQEPLELEAYTWNADDTYEHSLVIRVGLLSKKFIIKRLF